MNRLLIASCVAGVLGLIVASPAAAADMSVMRDWQSGPLVRALPYPRGERAQAVWDERACWSQCGSYNAWAMAACLKQDAQGRCLKFADRADRHCQRSCRTAGGPFVPDIFDGLE